jgi:hypothetical protein|tara:strand:- start:843 stop:1196 length:354 start_codon:yes stop_codon:yes gene_type:complete
MIADPNARKRIKALLDAARIDIEKGDEFEIMIFLADELQLIYDEFFSDENEEMEADEIINLECCEICKKKFEEKLPETVLEEIRKRSKYLGGIVPLRICPKCHNALDARSEYKASLN